jgi:hypothetical protein
LITAAYGRLEHFAKFQKRKSQFFEHQKRHLRHAVGKKTEEERNEAKTKRKEQNGPGSDDCDQGKVIDEDTAKTKGKGKAKAEHEERNEDIQDKALQERINRLVERKREEEEIWKPASQWRWEVLTGKVRKAEKMEEEKWRVAMEGGTSSGETEKPNNQAAQVEPISKAQETQAPLVSTSMDEKSPLRRGTIDSEQEEGPPPYEPHPDFNSPPEKLER